MFTIDGKVKEFREKFSSLSEDIDWDFREAVSVQEDVEQFLKTALEECLEGIKLPEESGFLADDKFENGFNFAKRILDEKIKEMKGTHAR